MKLIGKVRLVLGAVLVAAGLYALMAAPGLVSERESSAAVNALLHEIRTLPHIEGMRSFVTRLNWHSTAAAHRAVAPDAPRPFG